MGKWFRFLRKSSSRKKLLELESRLAALEHQVQKNHMINQEALNAIPETKNSLIAKAPATIHVEHLEVEKIIVEKLDYANNFGQLGIKELTGKLNIGTNCEGDFAKEITDKVKKKIGDRAKVNFHAGKEEKPKK
jgi:hypothetical protein